MFIRENIHKYPPISKLLCWMGRHDYEYVQLYRQGTALLKCFYCGREKASTRDEGDR